MFLVFDTETTGLPRWGASVHEVESWPRVVQLAWLLLDAQGERAGHGNLLIRPEGFTIPQDVVRIHGITTERALEHGVPLRHALGEFSRALEGAQCVVAHNLAFDEPIVSAEFLRCALPLPFSRHGKVCTMRSATAMFGKWPKLPELHHALFGQGFEGAHDAKADVEACAKCFLELRRRGIVVA